MIYMVFILIKPFSDHWCNVDAVIIIIEKTTFIRREIFIVKDEGDQSEELCMREESLQINTTKINKCLHSITEPWVFPLICHNLY